MSNNQLPTQASAPVSSVSSHHVSIPNVQSLLVQLSDSLS